MSALRFDGMEFDLLRGELRGRDGAPVMLRPKAELLLRNFLNAPGRLLAREALTDAVWPSTVVTNDSLAQCVGELRAALGDGSQRLIRTVPRRGYRFDATVEQVCMPATVTTSLTPRETGPIALVPAAATRWNGSRSGPWPLQALVAAATLTAVISLQDTRSVVRFGGDLLAKPQVPIASDVAARRSIVVMPFSDLSEPPAPHVAQAVDMDLTTDLGRMPDTRVVPRGSAAMLGTSAQVDLKRVANELHVRYVVTGSVRRDGEQLHIAVQLARTDTGELIWTERYDYVSAADWLGRRDVSARISNLLGRQVQEAAMKQALGSRQSDAAIDRWMRGEYLMRHAKTPADLQHARTEFHAALAAQPDSAHALAGLAMTYDVELVRRWMADRTATVATAEKLARRALEIDAGNYEAQHALRDALMIDGRLDEAMTVVRTQLAANQNDASANQYLAVLLFFYGRWEESLKQAELALQLDPLDPDYVNGCHVLVSTILVVLGRYDEAIERARLIDEPAPSRQLTILASAEALRGNLPEARRHAAELMQARPGVTLASLRATRGSVAPAYRSGMDHMAHGLRLAGLPEGASPTQ